MAGATALASIDLDPSASLHEVRADYAAALDRAIAYTERPAARPDVVAKLREIDAAAWFAITKAAGAIAADDTQAVGIAILLARVAVAQYSLYLTMQEIDFEGTETRA